MARSLANRHLREEVGLGSRGGYNGMAGAVEGDRATGRQEKGRVIGENGHATIITSVKPTVIGFTKVMVVMS